MNSKKRNLAIAVLVFLFGFNIYIWPSVVRERVWIVTFFDVGQGDAIFIECSVMEYIT